MPTRGLRGAYASLRCGTKTKSPETIYHTHISLYASPAAHTPATIYARICVDKLVDNLHIPSHLKNANEHLPTQLCLRNKNLHCFRGCLRTPPRTVKYQVVSLRDFIRSSLEYIMPCIQKKNDAFLTFTIWGDAIGKTCRCNSGKRRLRGIPY